MFQPKIGTFAKRCQTLMKKGFLKLAADVAKAMKIPIVPIKRNRLLESIFIMISYSVIWLFH